MSRNFELMQELGNRSWSGRTGLVDPIFVENDKRPNTLADEQLIQNESLRLVQRIFMTQCERPPRVVIFAGVNHGEGCSSICATVAETLAQNGSGSVCLVEANFRSPGLPAIFHTTNHQGLTNALLTEGSIRSFTKPVGSDQKLWLLSSGELTANSANLLSSDRVKERLSELRSQFDFVLIDAPPLNQYGDAVALGPLTDGVVLILGAESTRRESAQMATDTLRTAEIPILAAVLNNRSFPIPEKIYKLL
jgi:capsular exopolysaccharide synthesis family protein